MEETHSPQSSLNHSRFRCLPLLLVPLPGPSMHDTSKIPVHSTFKLCNSATTRVIEVRHNLPKTAHGVKGYEQWHVTVGRGGDVTGVCKSALFRLAGEA